VAASGEASGYVTEGGELHLSNPAQLELLRGMAERGVPLRTPVRGFSMTPFIRDGDVVTVAPLRGEPSVGQVVAVALPRDGRMALHRVIARRGDRWLVRGDNCPEADGDFDLDALVGRVVRVERDGHEVRCGVPGKAASGAALIAALSRSGWLLRLRAGWLAARRAAGVTLHAVQRLPAYRQAGRRLAPRVVVREATAADLVAVSARLGILVTYRDASPVKPHPASQKVVRWVAVAGGRVAGFVELVIRGPGSGPWAGAWLHSLMVWTPYRGLGVGEALTRAVLESARREGAEYVLLAVYADNGPALGLYRKLGFAPATLPELVPLLAKEAAETGRRRVTLRAALGPREGGESNHD
jgi:ribosomal protein S18 acetylase RimI-like enzyme